LEAFEIHHLGTEEVRAQTGMSSEPTCMPTTHKGHQSRDGEEKDFPHLVLIPYQPHLIETQVLNQHMGLWGC
ncbi:hypothetical protein ACQP3D_27220, partial [Escherichia coli]